MTERAPLDSEFWYSGTTFSGMPFHFTTFSIEDSPRNDGATPEDFAWLEAVAAGNDRAERNHAQRLLVTLRRPKS